MKPKLLLHLEGAAVLIGACLLYQQRHASWAWFALLFLTPDLFMLGYIANKTMGAHVYNLGHTYSTPLVVWLILWLAGQNTWGWLPIIWLAHIGFDRALGYGLKYDTAFKDTHFQKV